jgi:beta-lactamase regulating signal transducer with metallopeptidase domain/protocatechuate 3,4-dioxygenase beta subunit
MSLLELSDRWVVPGIAFLADWSVRWGVLLAMLFCWLAFLPPRRPAARYLLGVVFLAAGVLLPAVPRWGRIAISWPSKTQAVVEQATTESFTPPRSISTGAMSLVADEPSRPPFAINETAKAERPRPSAQPLGRWRWAALAVVGVWACVVFMLACRLIGGMLLLARLRHEAGEVDERSRRLLDDCTRAIPLSRRVDLAAHPMVGSPLTLGGLRPAILVPLDWVSWTDADRRICLLHELAHLARRDDWIKLTQEVIRVPFCFHPLVQWLMARIERERELLCDETVVGLGVDPPSYARLLLDLARRPGRIEPIAAIARSGCLPFLDRGTVAVRIERLLEENMSRTLSPPSTCRLIALGVMTLSAALGAGGVGIGTVEPQVKTVAPTAPSVVKAVPAGQRQIGGLIRGPDGKPVAGAVVVAGFDDLDKPNHQLFATDNDGRFTWSIPQGPISVYFVAHKAGLAPAIWMTWLDADKQGDHVELKLQNVEPFSAVLVDTAGHAVANARVRIEMRAVTGTEPGRSWTNFYYIRRGVIAGSPMEGLFETTTDQNGLFAFPASAPKTWLIFGVTTERGTAMRVRAEKQTRSLETSMVIDAGFVAATAGQPNRLVAFPAARVKGQVVTSLPGVSVAGLRVMYQDSDQPGKISPRTNIATQKVTTGADGRFLIDGLSEGTINMSIYGPGAGELWTYRAAQDVVLKSGETTDVGFEMIRGVDVEGKVVIQGSGLPVGAAGVCVYGANRPRSGASTQQAKTDGQGRYHVRMPPGEIYVYVMAPADGFTRLPDEGSSVTVTIPKDATHYDVPTIELAAAVTVRGRVVDAGNAPVAGAKIVGICEGNFCRPFPSNETVTDARGEFHLPEGGYNTVAKGKPARLLIRLRDGIEHEAATIPSNDGVVTVKLPVRNEQPAGVMGPQNIGPEELAGVVVDAQGKPLEGVKVDVWSWYPGNETHTDARGWFRLSQLGKTHNERKLEVEFRKPGYTPERFLKQPSGARNWVVVLDNKTYFEGIVLTPGGKPAPGASIRATPGLKQADGFVLNNLWSETTSDDKGHYRLYAQADVYDIQVRAPGAGTARLKDTSLGSDEARRLDIALQPALTFRARAIDSLTGKPVAGVRLSAWQHKTIEGRSDRDGMVSVADLIPGPFSFQVEAPGYGRWWSEQSPTAWHRRLIEPDRSGLPWQRNFDDVSFDLRPGMEIATIALEPEVKITGQVRDPNGKAVAGATVAPALTGTGNSLTGDARFSVETDASGHFAMALPASGEREYNLVAHDGKYEQWRTWANGVGRPFRTKPGERSEVVISLSMPARVRGRVIDAAGKPVAGRDVRASAADKLENRYYDPTVKTAADGSFDLEFVRAGEQFIQVAPFWINAQDAPEGTGQTVTLGPGETKEGLVLRAAEE